MACGDQRDSTEPEVEGLMPDERKGSCPRGLPPEEEEVRLQQGNVVCGGSEWKQATSLGEE